MDWVTLRLGDLAKHHTIRVRCGCGRITEFPYGCLQRKVRLPSDTLVFDLQFRLKCRHCQSRGPFKISPVDERDRGLPGEMRETVIVAVEQPKPLKPRLIHSK
jgi:hypothetical protein